MDKAETIRTERLKKGIRRVLSHRNILLKMEKHKTPFTTPYLNKMARDVMEDAYAVHDLLPYYIATKRI